MTVDKKNQSPGNDNKKVVDAKLEEIDFKLKKIIKSQKTEELQNEIRLLKKELEKLKKVNSNKGIGSTIATIAAVVSALAAITGPIYPVKPYKQHRHP